MDRGSKIFNFFADLLGFPTLNDEDDYVPIKRDKGMPTMVEESDEFPSIDKE